MSTIKVMVKNILVNYKYTFIISKIFLEDKFYNIRFLNIYLCFGRSCGCEMFYMLFVLLLLCSSFDGHNLTATYEEYCNQFDDIKFCIEDDCCMWLQV
jgi:hypothetical protein